MIIVLARCPQGVTAMIDDEPPTAVDDLPSLPGPWDVAPPPEQPTPVGTLFDLDEDTSRTRDPDVVQEFRLQRAAVEQSAEPGRIERLLAAESAGALIACELRFAGLPWSAPVHDAILTDALGPRPSQTERPEKLQAALGRVRAALDSPELNPDCPGELLRALENAGIQATSTRSWELRKLEHPAIEPLLTYKKLSRLLAANGWQWLDTWVTDGRFRPDYVPGGVVTGRWATSGGRALQLPK